MITKLSSPIGATKRDINNKKFISLFLFIKLSHDFAI